MRKLLLLIVIVVVSINTQAQSFFKFAVDTGVINATPATITPFRDSIINTGLHGFNDTLKFGAKINDSILQFPIDYISFLGTPIDSGQGQAVDLHIPFSSPLFINGPTGVIIWPIYRGGQAGSGPGDSLHLTIFMTGVGLHEAPLANIYLVQRPGRLSINFGDYQDIVQQVSLYDLSGRRIFSGSADQSRNIPTAGWSAGVYFCEIKTFKGETRTIKFVLQ